MMSSSKRVSTCGCYRNSDILAKPVLLFMLHVSRNYWSPSTLKNEESSLTDYEQYFQYSSVSKWTIDSYFLAQSSQSWGSLLLPTFRVAESRALALEEQFFVLCLPPVIIGFKSCLVNRRRSSWLSRGTNYPACNGIYLQRWLYAHEISVGALDNVLYGNSCGSISRFSGEKLSLGRSFKLSKHLR